MPDGPLTSRAKNIFPSKGPFASICHLENPAAITELLGKGPSLLTQSSKITGTGKSQGSRRSDVLNTRALAVLGKIKKQAGRLNDT